MRRPLQQASYGVAIAAMACAIPLIAQSGAKNGEWKSYGGEEASTRYSPLYSDYPRQRERPEGRVDVEVGQLRRRRGEERVDAAHGQWRAVFHCGRPACGCRCRCRDRRDALGVENGRRRTASTGATKEFRPRRSARADGRDGRIVVITPGFHIVSLNAKMGVPTQGFGQRGRGFVRGIRIPARGDRQDWKDLAAERCTRHYYRRPCPARWRACEQGKCEGRHHGL